MSKKQRGPHFNTTYHFKGGKKLHKGSYYNDTNDYDDDEDDDNNHRQREQNQVQPHLITPNLIEYFLGYRKHNRGFEDK